MILASAGSGKTYALTNRFVQLLALGAAPERIVALTFTRKAAGEFFDEILKKLARAATEPTFAATLAAETGAPHFQPGDFRRLLRAVIDVMPRLALGTFDSFFARIVRAFPLELGLSGDFEILQDYSARIERRRVLRRMFARTSGDPDAAQRAFMESFKRATFGVEEKQLAARLDGLFDAHQEVFLAAPERDAWGNAARIWPAGCPWLGGGDANRAATALQQRLAARSDLNVKQRGRWELFFAALADWLPGAPLPKPVDYILKNTLDAWEAVLAGEAGITIERRKVTFGADECETLAVLVCAIIGAELARRLEITQGIHAVLNGYESFYHDLVRRAGKLTFADVQRLLEPGAGGPLLTRGSETDDVSHRRLLLDWRLDGQFDHWLLDEFQDTSHGQWTVLRNLIDEVVQDVSRQRTFFYVGDVKQAIYAWRQGDARLLREIFTHYNRASAGVLPPGAGPAIAERRLDRSFRSGPAVLAMVNRVLGDAAVLASLFPREAAERWSHEWRDHTSARPDRVGHAAWLLVDDEDARFAGTQMLLQEIRPLERGLSVAVLVQKNDTAARLADFLRRETGLTAVAESDLHVSMDNPLTAAVMALFKAAAHPGDRLAREHVRMTPLFRAMTADGVDAPDALTDALLRRIHVDGFAGTVEHWLRKLEPALAAADAFSRERGRQLAEAARLFDETGGRDVAEFLAFLERHTVRDPETADVVRVMTIHKSKGLGFDVVILPDLEGDRLAQRREGLAVQRTPEREVSWVFDLPPRIFRDHDEILGAHVTAAEADGCYDKLALLYVGMTRAKRGLYVITEPVGKSVSQNFPRLLTTTLGQETEPVRIGDQSFTAGFSTGDPAWFCQVKPTGRPPPATPTIAPVDRARTRRSVRLPARQASAIETGTLSGAVLFAETDRDASAFGLAVHSALAAVEWWNPGQAAGWESAQRAAGLSPDAIALARASLDAPALAKVFQRPSDRSPRSGANAVSKSCSTVRGSPAVLTGSSWNLITPDASIRSTCMTSRPIRWDPTPRAGNRPPNAMRHRCDGIDAPLQSWPGCRRLRSPAPLC